MKIFDFNIHLPYLQNSDVNLIIENDLNLDINGLNQGLEIHKSKLEELEGVNIMLFNQKLAFETNFANKFAYLHDEVFAPVYKNVVYTALIDFRDDNAIDYLNILKENGIRGIKFHSYIQEIADKDFSKILSICQYAETLQMFICIDTSFGTVNLYKYDNLKLVALLAAKISKTPIILLHSGGARVIDAMLIADLQSNVYLETSFTIPFYHQSNIWKDLAFAYNKLGTGRILYATDFPYVSLKDSLNMHEKFFKEFCFSDMDIENIMYKNALNLIAG